MTTAHKTGQIPIDDRPSQPLKKSKLQKAKEDLHTGLTVKVPDSQKKM